MGSPIKSQKITNSPTFTTNWGITPDATSVYGICATTNAWNDFIEEGSGRYLNVWMGYSSSDGTAKCSMSFPFTLVLKVT